MSEISRPQYSGRCCGTTEEGKSPPRRMRRVSSSAEAPVGSRRWSKSMRVSKRHAKGCKATSGAVGRPRLMQPVRALQPGTRSFCGRSLVGGASWGSPHAGTCLMRPDVGRRWTVSFAPEDTAGMTMITGDAPAVTCECGWPLLPRGRHPRRSDGDRKRRRQRRKCHRSSCVGIHRP